MAPTKSEKKGLTLEKLAAYDDVITDALVDKVYYWTAIRKNRGTRFTASRGLQEEDIADIIRRLVIWEKDPAEAVQALLKLPGLRKYMAGLKDEKDQDQFKRHLRRYVNIYMPDCPFEVTTTNRYTIVEHEASITARRDISPREEIKYLTGVQVAMTEEQEKSLEMGGKDFSLVISSRKKTRSLFLGPARFANHDCDANARLSTKGYDGMQITAVKPIIEGEEITVSYGDDYFGENNEECLCRTCEDRMQNGWAPLKRVEPNEQEESGEEEPAKNQTPPSKSQTPVSDHALTSSKKRPLSPELEDASAEGSAPKRAKVEKLPSPTRPRASGDLREALLKKAHSTSTLRREVPVSSIEGGPIDPNASLQIFREMRNQQRDGLLTMNLDETNSSRETTPASPLEAGSPKSTHSTDATSVDDDHTHDNMAKIKVDPDETMRVCPNLGVATVKEEVVKTTVNAPWPSPPAEDDDMSDLSELSDSMEFDSENEQIVKRKPRPIIRTTRSKSRYDVHNRIGTPVTLEFPDDGDYEPNHRKPGDYMTSSSLLSAKYSKWVQCQTCDDTFVQADGYLTHKDCPRCERHSKLYGYAWPKTEKEGKHDKEERIKDHRTVHRFVDPDEERDLKRNKTKKKMKETIKERFSTPRSSMSASAEVDSGRKRIRVRKTM